MDCFTSGALANAGQSGGRTDGDTTAGENVCRFGRHGAGGDKRLTGLGRCGQRAREFAPLITEPGARRCSPFALFLDVDCCPAPIGAETGVARESHEWREKRKKRE
jgi:hypothetical protein